MNLSLNFYTQWYWKTDLHNLMHFLSLRADAHAQYEIRAYAEAMIDTLQALGPDEPRRLHRVPHGRRASLAHGLAVVKRLLAGEKVDQKERPQPARMARADGCAGAWLAG